MRRWPRSPFVFAEKSAAVLWAAAFTFLERNGVMQNRDTFSSYHPIINFLYFALVLVFSMCFMHPAFLVMSMAAALGYNIYLKGV